jgi:hypothetical protein
MRRHVLVVLTSVVAITASTSAVVRARSNEAGEPLAVVVAREDAKAAAIMAEARKALGGERKLAALKGLSLRAEFRREMAGPTTMGGATFVMMGGGGAVGGGGQMTGSIEIDVMFPDKFYRAETSTGGLAMTRIEGFEGSRPFFDIQSSSPGARIISDNGANDPQRVQAALRRTNNELGRLLLGLIGGTQPSFPAQYTYAGEAESPDTVAHVIDVTGPDDFKARLFIDTKTNLPLMLTYSEQEATVRTMTRGGPGGGDQGSGGAPNTRITRPGAGAAEGHTMRELTPDQKAELDKQMKELESAPRKMVDYRVFFADYRDVNGISLPHKISRGTAEKLTEEWEIKSYKVNPDIKPDRFRVGAGS